jgi:hypothetical protein
MAEWNAQHDTDAPSLSDALPILQRTRPYPDRPRTGHEHKHEYVTGEYFRGLAVSPAAGRL